MVTTISTVIATVGGVGLIVFLIVMMRHGTGDREAEEAARDFFSEHGHWPGEGPGEDLPPAGRES